MVEAYVSPTDLKTEFYSMLDEANQIIMNGSQEYMVLSALIDCGEA